MGFIEIVVVDFTCSLEVRDDNSEKTVLVKVDLCRLGRIVRDLKVLEQGEELNKWIVREWRIKRFFTQPMSSLILWNFITVNINCTLFDVTAFRSELHFMGTTCKLLRKIKVCINE